jgi:tRNA A37 methylthiotransferase MiaB
VTNGQTERRPKTVYVEPAYPSCLVTSLDCRYYRELFEKNGYTVVDNARKASVILLSMCTGEREAQKLSARLLNRHLRGGRNGARLVIGGCITPSEKQDLLDRIGCVVFRPGEEQHLAQALGLQSFFPMSGASDSGAARETCPMGRRWSAIRRGTEVVRRAAAAIRLPAAAALQRLLAVTNTYSRNSCIIRVSSGCMGTCTYCVERHARGKLRSRPLSVIVEEVRRRRAEGFDHFSLVADDVGYYGQDLGISFCHLVDALLGVDTELTLSLRCLNPRCLIEHLDEFLPIIVPGRITDIETPVQSGNNRILALMGRGHTIEAFFDALDRILATDPAIAFKTHAIVGFADETDEEFRDTVRIASRVPIENWNVTYYTANPQAASSSYPNSVSQAGMRARHRWLRWGIVKSFVRRSFTRRGF